MKPNRGYDRIKDDLRRAYDLMVYERDRKEISDWKSAERERFLTLLRDEGKQKLLEVGAGTGVHGKYFQDHGLQVISTDLSPEMVKRCREKGLEAYQMDFLSLSFPGRSFEAMFALNCLLHVPKSDLPDILEVIHDLLVPGGLFYWGQYGGIEHAGPWDGDEYQPPRFFSLLTDQDAKTIGASTFELESFQQVMLEGDRNNHFQSMVWRRSE